LTHCPRQQAILRIPTIPRSRSHDRLFAARVTWERATSCERFRDAAALVAFAKTAASLHHPTAAAALPKEKEEEEQEEEEEEEGLYFAGNGGAGGGLRSPPLTVVRVGWSLQGCKRPRRRRRHSGGPRSGAPISGNHLWRLPKAPWPTSEAPATLCAPKQANARAHTHTHTHTHTHSRWVRRPQAPAAPLLAPACLHKLWRY